MVQVAAAHRDLARLEGVAEGRACEELAGVDDVAREHADTEREEVDALLDRRRGLAQLQLQRAEVEEAAAAKDVLVGDAEAQAGL